MIPVENHPNLFRDPKTGAIVNCDQIAYNNYLQMKNAKLEEKEDLDKIKDDIAELKSMLFELLNNQKERE